MAKITTGQMFEQWELMNQKLEALDNKINGIIDGSTPANTQLTGSIAEEVTIFERGVRTQDTNDVFLSRPDGARGFIAYLDIRGITGTFETGQGVALRVRGGRTSGNITTTETTEATSNSNRGHIIELYPSGGEDVSTVAGSMFSKIPIVCPATVGFRIEVRGDFSAGQGVDCEVRIEWVL